MAICQTLSSKMEVTSDSPVSLSDKDLLEIRQTQWLVNWVQVMPVPL